MQFTFAIDHMVAGPTNTESAAMLSTLSSQVAALAPELPSLCTFKDIGCPVTPLATPGSLMDAPRSKF